MDFNFARQKKLKIMMTGLFNKKTKGRWVKKSITKKKVLNIKKICVKSFSGQQPQMTKCIDFFSLILKKH